ncbi:hypothetical protein [Actinomadura sp. CNU-125]|uniref:hypothetical protein n=1 Tax=Actinomadura sp. CNU-125 TaxID=1904961 RepID=UPI001178AC43|nr:hypothetical protein [Actinomadura sp. CNU-125]
MNTLKNGVNYVRFNLMQFCGARDARTPALSERPSFNLMQFCGARGQHPDFRAYDLQVHKIMRQPPTG